MKNKIILGDCIEEMRKLESGSVDLIITSPPYWKGYEYEAYFNSYAQYLEWSERWLKECKRVLKKSGTFYLNVINDSEITIRAFELMNIATRKLMWKLHDTIIWYRYNQQPANTTRQLTNQCEYLFMFRHSSVNIELDKKQLLEKIPEMFKTKNVGNVWELPFNSFRSSFGRKETKSKYGHSGFPINLPKACIILSSKEKDLVLDPFLGSGTTAIACLKLNRKFIGIEKEEEYVKIANARIKPFLE